MKPRRLNRELAALEALLPPGSSVLLYWQPCGVVGWRIAAKLTDPWLRALDVATAENAQRHGLHRRQWVRWPEGLSLGAGPRLSSALRMARRNAGELQALLCCPTCGLGYIVLDEVDAEIQRIRAGRMTG